MDKKGQLNIIILSLYAALQFRWDKPIPPPLFVAELEDADGINTVGNGIGHDLSLSIDGSAVSTYSLNYYYTPVAGDYTRGTVHFSVPELTEGETYIVIPCLGFTLIALLQRL
ncbi:MAG: hypothetical protein V8Q76_01685 [Bacteroides intestinalis]